MDCQTAEAWVSRYVNHDLSPEELEQFLLHIEDCPSCHEELETYFTVKWAVEQLDKQEDTTLDFHKLLTQDIRKSWRKVYKNRIQKFLKILTAFLLAAALMAVAMLLILEVRGTL